MQRILKEGLVSRSRLIWNQSTASSRRGYFLAGVGLQTGQALDSIAPEANNLLLEANGAILNDDAESAIAAITAIAERVFAFFPFAPDPIPANWRDILRAWLLGQPLAAIAAGHESETLQFIEGGLVYRLPWAMEAIRVRATANGDTIDDFPLDTYEFGLAVPAVVTGTLNCSAAILIQAGFNSRLSAIKAVIDTGAIFRTGHELRRWLSSEVVSAWSAQADWPTPETKAMWTEFAQSFSPRDNSIWADRRYRANVTWLGVPPPPGTTVQVHHWAGQPHVLSPDGTLLGSVLAALNPGRVGLVRAQVSQDVTKIDLAYLGPDDLTAV